MLRLPIRALTVRKQHGFSSADRLRKLFSTGGNVLLTKEELVLPNHIKFRMPDLDFKEVGNSAGATTLTKWYVQEGTAVKDGTHMCEIDTPDLSVQLESGDKGFIARLLVNEGAKNVAPGQPLAIIVPTAEDIEPFAKFLAENPHCIEGNAKMKSTAKLMGLDSSLTSSTATPTKCAASSDVLRMLNKLHKEGFFGDEKSLKVLKSMARKNDEQLLTTYKASYEDGVMEEAAFDKMFFVENALELAEESTAYHDAT
ncbi:Dihydrolipoamide acetyltransferase [Plasmopara halstedii]|uniref:Dihydrolipoamide acetyltransferase n=1 Tax=Plasmopara halstedii TaxID=4781 RepID=A0A0N7L4M8_PLAHL|nr:Dihydrolipoamide acetyltransferase [Plasmopara halstedii]CEG39115.1 Dihydrolipoamide acetyltransferase [Plasmopara halstedii]|eukprot:XP_024575484.1 Dihydrolipoamide acetyltransferase [Plasmopara halstedii]